MSSRVISTESARRRLQFQKSYSQEHGTSWRRRSLIEDAKFDTVTNAEFERTERPTSITETDDDVFTSAAAGGVYNGDVTNHVLQTPPAALKPEDAQRCTVMFTLQDASSMSKVFKAIELYRVSLQHVESRQKRKSGGGGGGGSQELELMLTLEGDRDSLVNVVKNVKLSGVVHDVVTLSEKSKDEKVPWFPRHITDLDKCTHLLTKFDPDIDQGHPGFQDMAYRERRSKIANIAFEYKHGEPIPRVDYSADEVECWRTVYRSLVSLFPTHACDTHVRNFRLLERECGYSEHRIVQLEDVSNFLKKRTGWQLRPVAGLLSARDFLASLAFRVFQCTQYIRHPSKPDHTVEPDCVHEILGHVPMLADPEFAQFSQEIGLASLGVSDEQIERFATLYWFTVEFGLCRQENGVRAYGAGLLSAFGELQHALSDVPEHRPFDAEKTSLQEYQDQDFQPVYFVAESFEDVKEKVRHYASKLKRPHQLRYDPLTQSIQILDNKESIQNAVRQLRAEVNGLNNAIATIERISLA